MLTHLVPAERVKGDLFDDRDPDRQLRLMRAVDGLNRDFGARTINFGYLGGEKAEIVAQIELHKPPATRPHGMS